MAILWEGALWKKKIKIIKCKYAVVVKSEIVFLEKLIILKNVKEISKWVVKIACISANNLGRKYEIYYYQWPISGLVSFFMHKSLDRKYIKKLSLKAPAWSLYWAKWSLTLIITWFCLLFSGLEAFQPAITKERGFCSTSASSTFYRAIECARKWSILSKQSFTMG